MSGKGRRNFILARKRLNEDNIRDTTHMTNVCVGEDAVSKS